MAAGDIALRLLITGNASGAIAAMGGFSGAVKSAVSGIGSGISNLAFGFNNLGTAGTIGTQAVVQGLTGMGKSFLLIGGLAAVAAAGIALAIGGVAVKAAGDFQVQMTKLYTTAGETQANLKMVGDGILAMAGPTATGAKQLGDAMYWIESGGMHGQKALDALRIAAQGAKAEGANLNDVSIALAASLNAYAGYGMTDAQVMNTLVAATGQGMMTMQQLSVSLANVLPASAKFGVSLSDVTAALATMTAQGDPASQAATHLKQMLLALEAPSKIGAAALKSVGLTSQQVSDEMKKSLPAAVQMITTAVGKTFPEGSAAYNQAIKNIAGGNKQMMGFLELSGSHFATFNANVLKITGSVKAGGNAVMGWAEIQKNFNFKIESAKAAFGAFIIQLGQQLMPIFNQLMTLLLPLIAGFLHWVMSSGILKTILQTLVNVLQFLVTAGTNVVNFFKNNEVAMAALKATLIVLSVIIGVAMVMALYSMAAAAWLAMLPFLPLIAIIAVIIIIVAAVILAIQHWGAIAHWLQGIWAPIAGFFNSLWNGIKNVAMTVWNAIVGFFMAVFKPVAAFFQAAWGIILNILTVAWNIIKTTVFVIFSIIVALILLPFLPLINWFKAHWAQIHAALTVVWNAIKSVAIGVWNATVHAIMTPINTLKGWLSTAWDFIKNIASNVWNGIKSTASNIWNGITSTIGGIVDNLKSKLSGAWDTIKSGFSGVMGALGGIAKGAWDNVVGIVKGAINFLISLIDNIIGGINNVTGAIGIPPIPMIPHLAKGGNNLAAGPYWVGENGRELLWLPRGSAVTSHGQSEGIASRGSFAVSGNRGGSQQSVVIHPAPVMIDKRQIGQILFDYQATELRRQGTVRSR